ncbi:MAG: DUF2865 domain-containing protein [Hyphomicrobiales bacterium]|nr:DUF2865 domain-containing protein [Hyphomicrobiales bacterium]MDE2113301.1 DUF2865 domain-containing protein [Hyphomicrobiales bacterium]
MNRHLRLWILGIALASSLGFGGSAQALSRQCLGLRAQIHALARRGNGGSLAAVRGAASQLARLENSAESMGCNNRKFLFFGKDPPRQCGRVEAQIGQLRARVAQLQSAAGSAQNGQAQLASLRAQYNDECNQSRQAARAAPPPQRNLFDALFGGRQAEYNQPPQVDDNRQELLRDAEPGDGGEPRRARDNGDDNSSNIIEMPSSGGARGGPKAVCVRTCDGAFFPVSYSARPRNFEALQELCTARCPNAEVKLYTYHNGADIGTAISTDGESYKDLASAFKYRTALDASCTCKPANQTWVQALAHAEEVLGEQDKGDIVVTKKQSDQMALPVPVKLPHNKAGGRLPAADPKEKPGEGVASIAPVAKPAPASTYHTIRGPNGVKRRVRIVEPLQ